MGRLPMVLLMLVVLAGWGCSGDRGKELFETARFEEKQHNIPHAVQLYEEIVRKYPESDLAKQAAARLAELKKGN